MASIEGIWLEMGNGRSDAGRAGDLRLNRLESRICLITARSQSRAIPRDTRRSVRQVIASSAPGSASDVVSNNATIRRTPPTLSWSD